MVPFPTWVPLPDCDEPDPATATATQSLLSATAGALDLTDAGDVSLLGTLSGLCDSEASNAAIISLDIDAAASSVANIDAGLGVIDFAGYGSDFNGVLSTLSSASASVLAAVAVDPEFLYPAGTPPGGPPDSSGIGTLPPPPPPPPSGGSGGGGGPVIPPPAPPPIWNPCLQALLEGGVDCNQYESLTPDQQAQCDDCFEAG